MDVKYLGMHFECHLTWSAHIQAKYHLIHKKTKSYHWLLGRNSPFFLENKKFLYPSVPKPIWLYDFRLWGWARASKIQKIQQRQNVFLRMITNAYRYTRNEDCIEIFKYQKKWHDSLTPMNNAFIHMLF